MADLDASLILQGVNSGLNQGRAAGEYSQTTALNAQKIQENALQLGEQQQELSDNQKLTSALYSANVDMNNTDSVVNAAKLNGVSGMGLLRLQKNLLSNENSELDVKTKALQYSEAMKNLPLAQRDYLNTLTAQSDKTFGAVLNGLTDKDHPLDPGVASTMLQGAFDDLKKGVQDGVQSGRLTPQMGQTAIKSLQQQMQSAFNKDGSVNLNTVSAMHRQLSANIDAVKQSEIVKNLAQASEATAKARQANEAAVHGKAADWEVKPVEVPVTNEDGSKGTETHLVRINKLTGEKQDTGAVAPTKGATAGASRQAARLPIILQAGEEGTASLENIAELPLGATSSGILGYGKAEPKTALEMTTDNLKAKLTGQDVASYMTLVTGLSTNLATLEKSGFAQGIQGLSKQVGDRMEIKAGDTNETALRKMAEGRQIIEIALKNALDNPAISDAQRNTVMGYLGRIRNAVPFTEHDITKWEKNGGNFTLNDYMSKNPHASFTEAAKGGGLGETLDLSKSKDIDKDVAALKSGTHFIGPDGVEHVRN